MIPRQGHDQRRQDQQTEQHRRGLAPRATQSRDQATLGEPSDECADALDESDRGRAMRLGLDRNPRRPETIVPFD